MLDCVKWKFQIGPDKRVSYSKRMHGRCIKICKRGPSPFPPNLNISIHDNRWPHDFACVVKSVQATECTFSYKFVALFRKKNKYIWYIYILLLFLLIYIFNESLALLATEANIGGPWSPNPHHPENSSRTDPRDWACTVKKNLFIGNFYVFFHVEFTWKH